MKRLGIIQGAEIILRDDGSVTFTADADIDCDGAGGNAWKDGHGRTWVDRYFQPETTLRHKGCSLNAHTVPFIVVPPLIIRSVKPVVMGCLAQVTHMQTRRSVIAVVGDIGPRTKVGEMSIRCAELLGVNPNPVNGGEDDFVIRYEIFPGTPAEVDGVLYDLQSA